MEEGVGFEPTERSSRSSVFKTDALNQPLPTFHMILLAGAEGFEPPTPDLESGSLPIKPKPLYLYPTLSYIGAYCLI